MNYLIFYSIICYLFMIGISVEYNFKQSWVFINLIFAPLIAPILLGMLAAKQYNTSK